MKAAIDLSPGSASCEALSVFMARVERIATPGIVASWGSCEDGTAELQDIWSERTRREGLASRYMREALVIADELGVTIRLHAHPCLYDIAQARSDGESEVELKAMKRLNKQTLLNAALIAWYQRLGFVPLPREDDTNDEETPSMVRRPGTPMTVRRKSRAPR